jgi:hypothetical protein
MVGRAGGSARREYERRHAKERARRRAALHITIPLVLLAFPVVLLVALVGVEVLSGALGRLTTTSDQTEPSKPVIPSSTAWFVSVVVASGATLTLAKEAWGRRPTTEAWRIGAEGEERVARRLQRLERHGFVVLHDLHLFGGAGNIDHVVVGPTGVFTVETKSYGRKVVIRRRLFDRETVITCGGRRLDGVVDQALRQRDAVVPFVRAAIPGRDVAVQPVVAVDRAEIERSWFARPVVRGVRWVSAPRVARLLRSGGAALRAEEIGSLVSALGGLPGSSR